MPCSLCAVAHFAKGMLRCRPDEAAIVEQSAVEKAVSTFYKGFTLQSESDGLCAMPHGTQRPSSVPSLVLLPGLGAALTTSEFLAESLVRTYLDGRTMEPIFQRAIVWMAQKRLISGRMPVLDATLRADIDNQASAPERPNQSSNSASETPTITVLLRRAYILPRPVPDPSAPTRSEGASGSLNTENDRDAGR
jgi:hypothetical protein